MAHERAAPEASSSMGQPEGRQQHAEAAMQQAVAQRRHADRPTWHQFVRDYYVSDAVIHMDTIFYSVHLVMTPLQRAMFVTANERMAFQAVIAACAAALTLRLFMKPLYIRTRTLIVLGTHLVLTVLRASVMFMTATHQAVLWRGPQLVIEKQQQFNTLLLGMVFVIGAPMRLLEVLGLQQSLRMHGLVALCFLAVHPYGAFAGARLAYSNALFYTVHEVHDVVAAVTDGLLSVLSGVPADQHNTCSSCAGVAVYSTLGLFGSLAVPLYLAYTMEQATFRHWCMQRGNSRLASRRTNETAGMSTPAAQGPSTAPAGQQQYEAEWRQPDQEADTVGSTSGGSSSSSSAAPGSSRFLDRTSRVSTSHTSNGTSDSSTSGTLSLFTLAENLAAADSLEARAGSGAVLYKVVGIGAAHVRWFVHALVLVCLLIGCWLVSNAVALVLLPRVLSSQQLDRWCPNRPYAPYVIAGQVYDGL